MFKGARLLAVYPLKNADLECFINIGLDYCIITTEVVLLLLGKCLCQALICGFHSKSTDFDAIYGKLMLL